MKNIPVKSQYRSKFPDLKPGFWNDHVYILKGICLACMDLISLSIALGIAILLWSTLQGVYSFDRYQIILPLLPISLAFFLPGGLYISGKSPVQELRDLTVAISISYLALAALSFLIMVPLDYSRFELAVGWFLSLLFVPLGREIIYEFFARSPFWGEPVVVIGYGQAGFEIAEYLVDNPQSGLYPVVVVDRRTSDRNKTPRVPVIRATDILEHPEMVEIFKNIPMAILVTNEINEKFVKMIVEERVLQFRRLVVISNSQQINNLWLRPYSIGEMVGFEIGQNLLSTWQKAVKRVFDLVLILILSPVLLPLFLIISLLVKLDSPGKVFSHQMRLGYKNVSFKIWRFRTLFSNSDEKLKAYLEAYPDKKEELDSHKTLKNDPCITRIGRLLRKTGLANLPQIVNVLRGEMSLIGPQAISPAEAQSYGQANSLYGEVHPGITGLWQVSNRIDPALAARLHFDEFYIRNWSLWLDYYILSRTMIRVISGKNTR